MHTVDDVALFPSFLYIPSPFKTHSIGFQTKAFNGTALNVLSELCGELSLLSNQAIAMSAPDAHKRKPTTLLMGSGSDKTGSKGASASTSTEGAGLANYVLVSRWGDGVDARCP